MDFYTAMKIAASGLSVQRERMNIISSNLANAETTMAADGSGPYKRRDIAISSAPVTNSFGVALQDALSTAVHGVAVTGVREDPTPPRQVFNPSHPHANAQGYVSLPNINLVEEVVNMTSATNAYQANATALESIGKMSSTAINLIK